MDGMANQSETFDGTMEKIDDASVVGWWMQCVRSWENGEQQEQTKKQMKETQMKMSGRRGPETQVWHVEHHCSYCCASMSWFQVHKKC